MKIFVYCNYTFTVSIINLNEYLQEIAAKARIIKECNLFVHVSVFHMLLWWCGRYLHYRIG